MEEFLLRAVLSRKKLDIVDHQRIERAIRGLEIVDGVVLQGLHHVADEALAVHVGEPRIGIALLESVRHGMHQVRLAETDAAVDEQRVVGLAGVAGHLDGGGLGELVALALDEAVEGEIRIDPAAETHGRQAAGFGGEPERAASRH